MNPTFATNKHLRNILIFILLAFTVLTTVILVGTSQRKYRRKEAFEAQTNVNHAFLFPESGSFSHEGTVFRFDRGALWAEEEETEIAVAYTSFVRPQVFVTAACVVFYEYPSKCFYFYRHCAFERREADIPISMFFYGASDRYAVLNDIDCRIAVYEDDGTLLSTLTSTQPIATAALSEDGKQLYVVKVSLSEPNTYICESYRFRNGKRLYSTPLTIDGIPCCAPYRSGCFVWGGEYGAYLTKRGKIHVLREMS